MHIEKVHNSKVPKFNYIIKFVNGMKLQFLNHVKEKFNQDYIELAPFDDELLGDRTHPNISAKTPGMVMALDPS